ncbi:plastocyanin/azurin family copper-binding protein [Nocardia arizonensis]|uniref:plastocyanin/azurin family copper-binding protein n=1 Tax=Nocardia arizonensis TaxID=1141647 RepID=UPI0006D19A17|nr:plastocyanin/azurin family copper-binding protein [Nocardia arizonensis]
MSIGSHVTSARVATGFVVAVTVALSSALLTGCGSDDSGTAATPSAGATASRTASPGPTKRAAVTVRVDDMAFSPADVTVKVGDTVTWKFSDRFPHSVQGMGDKAMGINSPIHTSGEWSYTFIAPGTYRYLCSLHPEMRGTVTVE